MALYIKKNGQIIRLDGNKLGNKVVATSEHLENLTSLNSYFFASSIDELQIDSFADTTSDLLKEYRITFKCASNFVLGWNVSGKTYRFAEGEPIWNTTDTYTLVITEGIDTDYLIYVVRG